MDRNQFCGLNYEEAREMSLPVCPGRGKYKFVEQIDSLVSATGMESKEKKDINKINFFIRFQIALVRTESCLFYSSEFPFVFLKNLRKTFTSFSNCMT